MHANGSAGNGMITHMQLAPLIDIALVLVIVFMVTAPRLGKQSGLAVDLPQAAAIEATPQGNVVITLTGANEIALNEIVMPWDKLEGELEKIIAKHPDDLVMIRADKQTAHKQVLALLGLAKRAGAKKMAIATLQRRGQ